MAGKNGQFSNSNDVNHLRKSKKMKKKTFDSYKKSFQDIPQKEKGKVNAKELRSYKSKKYTQSYDSNQFNFKFKRRKKEDKQEEGSPKKINIIHDGRKKRSNSK